MKYISGWLAQEAKLESIYPILIKDLSTDVNFLTFLKSTHRSTKPGSISIPCGIREAPGRESQSRQEDPIQCTLELHQVVLVGC